MWAISYKPGREGFKKKLLKDRYNAIASNALGEMSAKEFTDEKDVAEVEEKKHMLDFVQ